MTTETLAANTLCVHVTLLSKFRQYQDKLDAQGMAHIPAGATAVDLGEALGIPRKFVLIFLINGRQGDKTTLLRDGDVVVFVPPAVGGG